MKDKCTKCPECGCLDYDFKDYLGEGYRICTECGQEWYTTIKYDQYLSSAYYYEVFSILGRVYPPKDKKGDANPFDKRSVKRVIRKLLRQGYEVTAFVTKPNKGRVLVFDNYNKDKVNIWPNDKRMSN